MSDPACDRIPALDLVDGVPVLRLGAAQPVFDAAVDTATAAVRKMVVEGQPHLLVDASQAGFPAPSLVERLRMVRQWAEAAAGRLRIAVGAPPDFIDPERFGVVAAGQFGLSGQVFERVADAIAWLQEERAAELRRSD